MLSTRGRRPASVVVEPVARGLLRIGLTPNMVTVIGTVVTMGIAVLLIPAGHLVWAAVASAVFTAFDMVDGTMAPLSTPPATGSRTAPSSPRSPGG